MLQNIGFDLSGITGHLLHKTWMLQRTYNWHLMMPHDIGGNIGYLISQYCQEVRFGDYTMSELATMRYGAYQRFYAGLQDIDKVTLSFLVPIDNSVYSYFAGWSELIVDKRGYYHPKNEYKKNIYAIMYDRTSIQSTKFMMKGTFPITKVRADLSYRSEDVLRLNVTLSVDTIEPSSFIGSIREAATGLLGGAIGGVSKAAGNLFGG